MDAMTHEMAEKMIAAAQARAREIGVAITVAVVDAGGHLKELSRMDGAGWLSVDIAIGKAYGAAAFRRDTEEMLKRLEGKEVFATAVTSLSGGKAILGQGGFIVRNAAEESIGAVGVSGATSEQDAACGQAGVDALKPPAG
jgi:uncharacterized protein GlcG (DUF336 family)